MIDWKGMIEKITGNGIPELLFDQSEERKTVLVHEPTANDLRERLGLSDGEKEFCISPYVGWHVLQHIVYSDNSVFLTIRFQVKHSFVNNQLVYLGCGRLTFKDCENISRNLRAGEAFVASLSDTMNKTIVDYGGAHMRGCCLVIINGGIFPIDDPEMLLKLKLQSKDCFPLVCKSSIQLIDKDEARIIIGGLQPMPHLKKAKVVNVHEYT